MSFQVFRGGEILFAFGAACALHAGSILDNHTMSARGQMKLQPGFGFEGAVAGCAVDDGEVTGGASGVTGGAASGVTGGAASGVTGSGNSGATGDITARVDGGEMLLQRGFADECAAAMRTVGGVGGGVVPV